MFGMSMTELMIIMVLALVLIGPEELPKAAKTIGKTLRDIQRAGDDLRETFEREVMSEVKRPDEPPLGSISRAKDQLTALGSSIVNEVKDAVKAAEQSGKPEEPAAGKNNSPDKTKDSA